MSSEKYWLTTVMTNEIHDLISFSFHQIIMKPEQSAVLVNNYDTFMIAIYILFSRYFL